LSAEDTARLREMSGEPIEKSPAGIYTRKIMDRLLIDLSWNSSRLEGNTYSLLETEQLFKIGESIEGKSAFDAQMILNHKDAIEYLVDEAETLQLNTLTIRNIHAMLSDGLLGNRFAIGSIRKIPVKISGTVYSPNNIPAFLEECLHIISKKANLIKNPFEAAFFLLIHLSYPQAFEDVNKRVARIAGNLPLIQSNHCPISFVDVPSDVYLTGLIAVYELIDTELLRDVFLWAYHRSTQRYASIRHEIGDPDPFYVRHRENIRMLSKEVVLQGLSKMKATQFIQEWAAKNLEKPGRARFVESVEQELLSLNPGNIARHRIRSSQFDEWQKEW
jgi:hypothetical protein